MIVVMLCCHVRRYMQVCHVMLQNACCDSDLSVDFRNFGTSNFPFKSPFKKCFEIVFFSLWRRDPSGLGAAIADALARSSIVFCNSVSADRIVVSGCVKVAWCPGCMRNTIVFCSWISQIVLEWLHQGCDSDLSADFSILALVIFLVKFLFKKCFKIVFFLWRRDPSGFGAAIPIVIMYKKASLCIFFL